MANVFTYPLPQTIKRIQSNQPDFMVLDSSPMVVVAPGVLHEDECKAMRHIASLPEPYKFPTCGATTTEQHMPLHHVFRRAVAYTRMTNSFYWNFTLNDQPAAWLQEYERGGSYPLHRDGNYGQARKLTCVVLLTHPDEYEGGELVIHNHPEKLVVTRLQGTLVMFPSWVYHEVTKIINGHRESINIGFWGPPFR